MKAKKRVTWLWGFPLVLALLVGLLSTTALAADATADFVTNPVAAENLLGSGASWNSDTNTLTLNSVNFTTSAATAVKLPDGAIIELNGENTITSTYSGSGDCYGIYGAGSLTIQGTGTLNVTSGTPSGLSFGIHAQASVTINSGAVTATGGAAPGYQSYGIRALHGDLTIKGGTVTANGGNAKESSGLWAGDTSLVISGGKVVAQGGNVINGTSSGIFAKNVEINNTGAIVTATGGTAQNGNSFGIYAYRGKVTFSGGTLTAATKDTTCINGTLDVTGSGVKTISFDSNDGDGTMMAKTTAEEYTLPANGFTPPAGMQLKGWAESVNGDVISGPLTVDGDKTLYAIWEDITYTVTVTGGTASVENNTITTATMGATVKLTANETPEGKVFDQWVVDSGSTSITLANANSATTTFTMPAGAVSVKATYASPISSVAITGIDAPVSNTALDTTAACETTGVSTTTTPTVTWTPSATKAGYGAAYTASVTLTAAAGYAFADDTTATVNGNPATSVTKNANGTLTVTYTFPATDKHNIEITVDTDVRGGDAAKNPTISSGYEIEYCFFVEDTDKDGVFINKTGNDITLDDKTMVVDKALVEAFAAQSGGSFTYESLMAAIKGEFDLDELKTEFTGGYDYSVLAYICHSDNAYFAYDDNQIVTNAIVKVNGKKITDNCLGYGSGMEIIPVAYVFSAATGSTPTTPTYTPPTYKVESTVSKDADGSVSFSKSNAKKGDTVTITVTPDRYYKVAGVSVKDKNGKEIAVTDNGDGTFTFKMPDSKVTVDPVFSWDNPFGDVAEDTYYAPAVEWALKNDVTDGTSDTTFSPNAGCTRAQIVTFLWRAAGCPEPADMSSFTDVSADSYYAKAVAWAVEQGITDGTGGGEFSPDAVCTRGQIVTFLWRAEKSPAVGTANPFTDVETDAYYAGATNWAVENGITEGTGDGTTFSPANDCTRAQIVAFLYRFFVK